MQKRIVSILFLTVTFLVCSTCRKISEFPFNMYGEWISNSECGMYLVINKNGYGTYSNHNADKGCHDKSWSGKVRFTSTHLYFGATRFKFIKKPEELNGSDSVLTAKPTDPQVSPYVMWYHKTATITVENSIFHTGETITYYKIFDY